MGERHIVHGRMPQEEPRRRVAGADGVTALSLYLFLIIAIPSRLGFAPLGGAGSPAQMLAMCLLLWWLWHSAHRVQTTVSRPGSAWVPRAMLLYCAAVTCSYIAAMMRPIDPTERRLADLGMLGLAAWTGVVMTSYEGITSRDRFTTLARRLTYAGLFLGALGVAQFTTRMPFTNYIEIPGLSANAELVSLTSRDDFSRPAGTALHPIEFGVVLTMLLPFCLHFAMYDQHRSLVRRWAPVAAVCVAIPISLSRSALVGGAVVLIVLFPTWSWPTRLRALVAGGVLGTALFVTVPGLLGTLNGLFSHIGGDSSAQSRTGSYELAAEFIQRAPLFGRGMATFLPKYRILDNQYLLTLIETGFIGLTALLATFLAALVSARRARAASIDPAWRSLCQALLAALASGVVACALFDGFSFPMLGGLLLLLVGMSGAAWRLSPPAQRQHSRHSSQAART